MAKKRPAAGGKREKRPKEKKPGASRKPAAKFRPQRLSKQVRPEREEDGPHSWFLSQIEATYFGLTEGEAAPGVVAEAAAGAAARSSFRSVYRPGARAEVLATPDAVVWVERLSEYKRRKASAVTRSAAFALAGPPGPFVPGARNWAALGPMMVLQGQTVGEEPVGGRVAGIAVAPGGLRVYAAAACGGVFRSDDGGTTWRSLMDAFDVDPVNFASTSLACGAIAIDPADPDRIYVGTGEGDTHAMFLSRIVNALPAYRGIGPIRSDDGGANWLSETTAAGSPGLAGEAFFALAVDPTNRENVIAATTAGLYQRAPNSGAFEWRRRRPDVHSSVVVAETGGSLRFFAAKWGGDVLQSTDGETWTGAGTGFPTGIGRIALGVRRADPSRLYALVATTAGALQGVYRLDGGGGAWKRIASPPNILPGGSQGDYDLAIAVDPNDSDLVYLGGSYANATPWPGSVWRSRVQSTATGLKFAGSASIGTHAHADVHVLVPTPNDSNELWCGCDGGVFLNRAARTVGQFAGVNNGLACLCSNFISQHPTDPNILFTGLQDNGTARTSGGSAWTHVGYGDGGYCLVNWADPNRVLTFANGKVNRSTTGGTSHSGWSEVWSFGWATMTQPIVSMPYNAGAATEAEWVAVGAGNLVYVSRDFAGTWPMQFALPGGAAAGSVFALAFASTSRIFIGTTRGRVFRADRTGTTWTVSRLDDVAAGGLPISGLITDVAVDWSVTTNDCLYVAFGGMGDRRHVWRFDGVRWEARSGTTAVDWLLDVEHNALAVDAAAAGNVYVGADIGVWHSSDGGLHWEPLQNGLPDAPVFDLQIHPTQRLLRAATHGRGVFEIAL